MSVCARTGAVLHNMCKFFAIKALWYVYVANYSKVKVHLWAFLGQQIQVLCKITCKCAIFTISILILSLGHISLHISIAVIFVYFSLFSILFYFSYFSMLAISIAKLGTISEIRYLWLTPESWLRNNYYISLFSEKQRGKNNTFQRNIELKYFIHI